MRGRTVVTGLFINAWACGGVAPEATDELSVVAGTGGAMLTDHLDQTNSRTFKAHAGTSEGGRLRAGESHWFFRAEQPELWYQKGLDVRVQNDGDEQGCLSVRLYELASNGELLWLDMVSADLLPGEIRDFEFPYKNMDVVVRVETQSAEVDYTVRAKFFADDPSEYAPPNVCAYNPWSCIQSSPIILDLDADGIAFPAKMSALTWMRTEWRTRLTGFPRAGETRSWPSISMGMATCETAPSSSV